MILTFARCTYLAKEFPGHYYPLSTGSAEKIDEFWNKVKELVIKDLSVDLNVTGLLTQTDKKNGILALFRCKMAFLKSKFKDDPVRVQRHTVPHFKDLE